MSRIRAARGIRVCFFGGFPVPIVVSFSSMVTCSIQYGNMQHPWVQSMGFRAQWHSNSKPPPPDYHAYLVATLFNVFCLGHLVHQPRNSSIAWLNLLVLVAMSLTLTT